MGVMGGSIAAASSPQETLVNLTNEMDRSTGERSNRNLSTQWLRESVPQCSDSLVQSIHQRFSIRGISRNADSVPNN